MRMHMKRIKKIFQWVRETYYIMVDPLDERSGLTKFVFYEDDEGITLKSGDSVTFEIKENK